MMCLPQAWTLSTVQGSRNRSASKLKSALQELHNRNAQLVMRNEKLNLQLSFMPPKMWDIIAKATRERSHYYEQQRTDPHHLHPTGGEYMFLRSEPGDRVADTMQRCATVTSVQDLHLEVEYVLEYLKSHDGIVDKPINERRRTDRRKCNENANRWRCKQHSRSQNCT
jgi:hypothetical protein